METSRVLMEARSGKSGGTNESQGIEEYRFNAGKPVEAHLAAHLRATQWLRSSWPP